MNFQNRELLSGSSCSKYDKIKHENQLLMICFKTIDRLIQNISLCSKALCNKFTMEDTWGQGDAIAPNIGQLKDLLLENNRNKQCCY